MIGAKMILTAGRIALEDMPLPEWDHLASRAFALVHRKDLLALKDLVESARLTPAIPGRHSSR